jgi:hypothetical protein
MAKVRLGALAGQISGSVGALTFAHNRGGSYVRNRSLCVKHTTKYAMDAKERFTLESRAWADLDDTERLAWQSWAANYPITDTMGEKRILTGHQAFCGINSRRNLGSDAQLDLPPGADSPDGLTALSMTGDIGAGAFTLVYTPDPIAATEKLYMYGCILPHAGIAYVKNRLKFIGFSSAAEQSPYDWQSDFVARLGTPVVGQIAVAWIHVYDNATGLISLPRVARVTVTST